MQPTDMLLLNASNYPGLPIFPYAFVQVRAVARRFGVRVEMFDSFHTAREERPAVLSELIRRHRPRMIGFHLRQPDSQQGLEYAVESRGHNYYPVRDTQVLIQHVRSMTDAPIALGGIGFSSVARSVCKVLTPDYGVVGDPDDFFRHFDALAAGGGPGL